MPSNIPDIEVTATPQFKRDLRTLSKKYRHVRSDVQSIIERLEGGELPGDRIPGTGSQEIFKVRVKNSDIKKGKSAGYRVIYYLQTSTSRILITIYSKSETANISAEKIIKIVSEFEALLEVERQIQQESDRGDRPDA